MKILRELSKNVYSRSIVCEKCGRTCLSDWDRKRLCYGCQLEARLSKMGYYLWVDRGRRGVVDSLRPNRSDKTHYSGDKFLDKRFPSTDALNL